MSAAAVAALSPERERRTPSPSVLTLAAPATPYSRPKKTLGDPTPLACTVAKTALEVVLGSPHIHTLNRWVAPPIREALAHQSSLARRAGRSGEHSVRVARVRLFRVSATAAEVSIVAHDGERHRAIAMRLEEASGRWLTTVLQVG